jgi:hypothetical protein
VKGWKQAAARIGVSRAMLVDSDGVVHVTPELRARLHFGDPVRIAAH